MQAMDAGVSKKSPANGGSSLGCGAPVKTPSAGIMMYGVVNLPCCNHFNALLRADQRGAESIQERARRGPGIQRGARRRQWCHGPVSSDLLFGLFVLR